MTAKEQQQLGKTLWNIADELRGAMNADDFRDYKYSLRGVSPLIFVEKTIIDETKGALALKS